MSGELEERASDGIVLIGGKHERGHEVGVGGSPLGR